MMTRTDHLYIHVPFCKTICAYCDFCHVVYREETAERWLKRLEEDFAEIKDEGYSIVYIGGGTPSSLNIRQLRELLDIVRPFSRKTEEYTIEINPESIDEEKVLLLKEYGINRVSIGLQSSDERLLKLMNRHHSFEDVRKTVELLRKHGLINISLDVLYSLPSQTMDDLKKTVKDVLELDVPHVSLYSLTIEKGTIFDRLGYQPLDEETEADMYEYIGKELTDKGYIHYEIANFAKEGFQSRHNLGYWNYDDYRGMSCGAVGKIHHKRYTMTSDLKDYLEKKDIMEVEDIATREEAFENIMMSLRTIYGLDLKLFKERYGIDFTDEYKDAIEKNKDHLLIKDDHCICKDGEILNTILIDFIKE